MAATTSGALKALIEGGGLSLAAYRDEAPDGTDPPYAVINEGISLVPDPSNTSDGTQKQVREQAQVSLWQELRDESTGAVAESYTLPDDLVELLDGASLPMAPKYTWGVFVLSAVRLPERNTNRVQTAITVEIIRDL